MIWYLEFVVLFWELDDGHQAGSHFCVSNVSVETLYSFMNIVGFNSQWCFHHRPINYFRGLRQQRHTIAFSSFIHFRGIIFIFIFIFLEIMNYWEKKGWWEYYANKITIWLKACLTCLILFLNILTRESLQKFGGLGPSENHICKNCVSSIITFT